MSELRRFYLFEIGEPLLRKLIKTVSVEEADPIKKVHKLQWIAFSLLYLEARDKKEPRDAQAIAYGAAVGVESVFSLLYPDDEDYVILGKMAEEIEFNRIVKGYGL